MLPIDSVANVSQVVTVDRSLLTERIGRLARPQLELIWQGIDIVFEGRASVSGANRNTASTRERIPGN